MKKYFHDFLMIDFLDPNKKFDMTLIQQPYMQQN